MGKNKSRKKNGSGEIIDIFRNYGFIRTDSFGQDMEEIPFEITKDMIQYKDGKEFIEYSVNVNFELKKGVFLRDRNIREAINLKFDKNNPFTKYSSIYGWKPSCLRYSYNTSSSVLKINS